MKKATATAHANIALVKYWGKRDVPLNLPEGGSISLTLEGLKTTTTVCFGESREDLLILDGRRVIGQGLQKVLKVVDLVRRQAQLDLPVQIESHNDFPTAAGLASSSSGFAALTMAAAAAAGLDLSRRELSVIARQGSGSACRSLFGGFAEWLPGDNTDGSDSHAVPLYEADYWPMSVLIAVVNPGPKPVGSTQGMQMTASTSPYHSAFVQQTVLDLEDARTALAARDFGALGQVAERSALRMHADMMAADPGLIYMSAHTLQVIQKVRDMQSQGMPVFFTVDAGPNVKVFCADGVQPQAARELKQLACVQELLRAAPGPGACLVDA